jgi:hypothetical protein
MTQYCGGLIWSSGEPDCLIYKAKELNSDMVLIFIGVGQKTVENYI